MCRSSDHSRTDSSPQPFHRLEPVVPSASRTFVSRLQPDVQRIHPWPGPPERNPRLQSVVSKLLVIVLALATAGCDPWMEDQPKYEPLEFSPLIFRGAAGGPRWTREPVPGTVARGFVRDAPYEWDEHFLFGTIEGEFVDEVPQGVLEEQDLQAVMLRGQERYGIFCAPCHDLVGTGNGRIPQRGYPYPPSFHSEELRRKPLGHYFRVISNGMGRMPPYGKQVPPEDRWAIAAYIRALQLSQHAQVSELPQTDAQQIEQSGPPPERMMIPDRRQ